MNAHVEDEYDGQPKLRAVGSNMDMMGWIYIEVEKKVQC